MNTIFINYQKDKTIKDKTINIICMSTKAGLLHQCRSTPKIPAALKCQALIDY